MLPVERYINNPTPMADIAAWKKVEANTIVDLGTSLLFSIETS